MKHKPSKKTKSETETNVPSINTELPTEVSSSNAKETEELRKKASERDEFFNSLQRVQADFLNYQARIKREKEDWYKYKSEDILQQLLNAFDNLDRVLKIKCESKEAQCLLDGINLTKKEIVRVLEKNGVTPIKTTGETFDPARHEAVMAVDDKNQPDNTVIEEINPGYLLHDRVLRPAQVKVVKRKNMEPDNNPADTPSDPEDKKIT